jgi:hypothetical protein
VGIESAILVDHEHARELPRGPGGPDEVPPHGARPGWRGVLDVFGREAGVVLRNLLGLGEPGVQGIEQHGGGDTTHGEPGRAVDEPATIEGAVDVGVEQDQQLGVEVLGFLEVHTPRIHERPSAVQVEFAPE